MYLIKVVDEPNSSLSILYSSSKAVYLENWAGSKA